jgi:hypothetical protein
MTQRGLVCLLLGALAWGQAAKPASAPKSSAGQSNATGMTKSDDAAKSEAKVAATDPVITISNMCDKPGANNAECKTVVTRAEFEHLMDTVAPNAPPAARRQIASRYAQMLVMSHDAEKMGLDKTAHFDEMMRISRMQVLAQALQQDIQEKAADVPEKDIQAYYDANKNNFEEATLQRVFVPKSKQLAPPKEKLSDEQTQKRQEAAEAAMKTEAEALQKRAAAGEDFGKLQKEAFETAGMKAQAPTSNLPDMRRNSLPMSQRSVFDLKDGAVSPVIADGAGYFIYKMGTKQILPLDKVKEEIHNQLRAQRMQESMEKLQQASTPVLNDDYFGNVPEGKQPMIQPGFKPAPKPSGAQSKPTPEKQSK